MNQPSNSMNTQRQLLDPDLSQELATEALAWASVNGFQMAQPDDPHFSAERGPVSYMHVPFSLLPNAVPKNEFERAVRLAPLLNLLVDAVASDQEWLMDTLQPVLEGDPFTARLASLMTSSPHQPVRLGLHRSDYMIDDGASKQLLQVEMNTIASSFGCVSSRATRLHRHLLSRFLGRSNHRRRTGTALATALHTLQATYDTAADASAPPVLSNPSSAAALLLPENPAAERLSGALAAAHSVYLTRSKQNNNRGATKTKTTTTGRTAGSAAASASHSKLEPSSPPSPVVLFVVQAGEQNVVDQVHTHTAP
jgi:glutathione synthase